MGFGYAVYFTDRAGKRVIRWDPDEGTAEVVAGEPPDGDRSQKLDDHPHGVAFDPRGSLLVSDDFRICRVRNGRLEALVLRDPTGHRERCPESPAAYDPRQLVGPSGMVPEPGGTLLCAFLRDHTVYRIHPSGDLELVLGVPKVRGYQFGVPREVIPPEEIHCAPVFSPDSIVTRRDGTIFFTEKGYLLLREYHPERGLRSVFPLGLQSHFSDRSSAPEQAAIASYHPSRPGTLALDRAETLYLAETRHGCVLEIDPERGKVRRVLESRKPESESPGGISALTFGPDGTAWVMDASASLIEAYVPDRKGPWKPLDVGLGSVNGKPLRFPAGTSAGMVTGN